MIVDVAYPRRGGGIAHGERGNNMDAGGSHVEQRHICVRHTEQAGELCAKALLSSRVKSLDAGG